MIMRKIGIQYYSTNSFGEGIGGIKPFKKLVSFKEALLQGQAPDEGLYMPEKTRRLPKGILNGKFGRLSYAETALAVTWAFLEKEIPKPLLKRIIEDAYDFPTPIEHVKGLRYVMRLDQGKTASFKDYAARLMARLMSALRDSGERLNVLVATSGDTGSAVGEAFKGVDGINVVIFYPRHEVSQRQKKQLDTIGENVKAVSVAGKFDDCQDLVKTAFSDPDLAHLNLTSANSISFGRIMPQIIYYVYAYLQLALDGEDIVFSVPSGNFGDALGCEYARRMGLPVSMLITATNGNDEFPKFMETGIYQPKKPSMNCLSNAMNVGHPSNLARFFDLYGGTVDRYGQVHKMPDIDRMRKNIFAVSVSDQETEDAIVGAYQDYGVILEQHGAVGWVGLERYLEYAKMYLPDPPLSVCVETAHPAKFPDMITKLLGITPELPANLRDIDSRTGEPDYLDNDYKLFKQYLLDTLERE